MSPRSPDELEGPVGAARVPDRSLWVTWEVHRRTREIARTLRVPLHEILASRGGGAKYPGLLARTLRLLQRERPGVLFVQCPSVVLGWLVAVLQPLLKYRLVADLHNEAVKPFVHSTGSYRTLLRRIHATAALSLVSNSALETTIAANGGRPFVLPDRLPRLQAAPADVRVGRGKTIAFVCTFAPDEPWEAVVRAARSLPDGVDVVVTGRVPAGVDTKGCRNLRFAGFLPEAEYVDTLAGADAVMDLTEMEDCLVCGGYEAVALERPLITSDTRALRSYFRLGTVYTTHEPGALACAMLSAMDRSGELEGEMAVLQPELRADWDRRARELVARIEES